MQAASYPPPPQPPSTLTVPALTHRLMCSIHTDRCWYHSSTTDCEGLLLVMNSWAQRGPPVTPIPPSLVFLLVLFCFFVCLKVVVVVGWGGEGRGGALLVKWIKIPNNSNNNDTEKLIKNGMFLPDCASVVVFNYAIFIGILIIFSTNKPPLIKAKHG